MLPLAGRSRAAAAGLRGSARARAGLAVRPFVTGRARRAGRFPSADASRLRSSVSMTLRTEPDPDIRITQPEPARWECLPGVLFKTLSDDLERTVSKTRINRVD